MNIKKIKLKDREGSPKTKQEFWMIENGEDRKIIFQDTTDGMLDMAILNGDDLWNALSSLVDGKCDDVIGTIQKITNYGWAASNFEYGLNRAEASHFDIEIFDGIPSVDTNETGCTPKTIGITAPGYGPKERTKGPQIFRTIPDNANPEKPEAVTIANFAGVI